MAYRWKRIPQSHLPIALTYHSNLHTQGIAVKIHWSESTNRHFAQFAHNGYWYERVKVNKEKT